MRWEPPFGSEVDPWRAEIRAEDTCSLRRMKFRSSATIRSLVRPRSPAFPCLRILRSRALRVVPRGSIMDDKQVNVQSLYAKVDHTCVRVGIVLACSWLFAAFSYYLSKKTGTDWFARSGSVMALIGAAATLCALPCCSRSTNRRRLRELHPPAPRHSQMVRYRRRHLASR